jgi:ribosomal protein L37AE/L43A
MDEKESGEQKKDAIPWQESDDAFNLKCPRCGSTEMKLVQRRSSSLASCQHCRRMFPLDSAMEEYDLSKLWGDD